MSVIVSNRATDETVQKMTYDAFKDDSYNFQNGPNPATLFYTSSIVDAPAFSFVGSGLLIQPGGPVGTISSFGLFFGTTLYVQVVFANPISIVELLLIASTGTLDDFLRTMFPAGIDVAVAGSNQGDVLQGSDNNDQIRAGAGNDTVIANLGNDDYRGGGGEDLFSLRANVDFGLINLNVGRYVNGADSSTLRGFENAEGSRFGDTIIGDKGANHLSGLSGRDMIHGRSGNDQIFGNKGNDVLNGDNGNDIVNGGAGNDLVKVSKGKDKLIGGADRDTVSAEGMDGPVLFDFRKAYVMYDDKMSTLRGFENAVGGNKRDILNGDNRDNTLSGRDGRDNINGRGGDDRLNGNGGNDRINGGAGEDRINGGAGDDELKGGADDDIINGGDGDDTIDGGTGDDEVIAGPGNDAVKGNRGDDLVTLGKGRDAFLYRFGDGDDTIQDFRPGIDSLDLVNDDGEFLTRDDLKIERDGSASVVKILENGTVTGSITLLDNRGLTFDDIGY